MGKEILSVPQKQFLKFVAAQDEFTRRFYLTGGTALSAYYLNHRYSEDLDFFSEEDVDLQGVNVFLRKAKPILDIAKIDFQQAFNRNIFLLKLAGSKEILKVEFTYYPFSRIEKSTKEDGISVDSLLDIAVNKIFTLAEQPRARDFVDIYFILQRRRFSFKELLKKARVKFDWQIDPLQFGAQLLKAGEVKDYPRMLKKINHGEWQKFFIAEAKKFKSIII